MRTFSVPSACHGLESARAAHPSGPWEELGSPSSRQQREVLVQNQGCVCAWCESQIKLETSHIDHIRSRNRNPNLTFEVSNLVASCDSPRTCGHCKQSEVLPDWVHPYETSGIEDCFTYEPDGSIRPVPGLPDEQATEADWSVNDLLNLNDRILKERRETQMVQINSYAGQGISEEQIASFFSSFPSLVHQLLS